MSQRRWSLARIVIVAFGTVLILIGLILQFQPDLAVGMLEPLRQPGAGPIMLGALLVLSTLFEGRYRRSSAPHRALGPEWKQTNETFRDEESGQWLVVWFNPVTGERRYLSSDAKR